MIRMTFGIPRQGDVEFLAGYADNRTFLGYPWGTFSVGWFIVPLHWIDVSGIPFGALLLLEWAHLRWFPLFNFPQAQLGQALAGNPYETWFIRHMCPRLAGWLDSVLSGAPRGDPPGSLRLAELAVLGSIQDLLIYALDPTIYNRLKFLDWDSRERTCLTDFHAKVVLDIGSGTGRLTFTAAPLVRVVYAVEPVGNLGDYRREKAVRCGCRNYYAVDGLIRSIPFEDHFVDVGMSGYRSGGQPDGEAARCGE